MHRKILSKDQIKTLPLIKVFSDNFYLVGGTAIALYLGHRRSIDFDLFSRKNIKPFSIKKSITKQNFDIDSVLYENHEQIHLIVNKVKVTFFHYEYLIPVAKTFSNIIGIPSLLDLGAMKFFALGKRAKWKDYVDLYFILKDHFSLKEISQRSKEIFGNMYNELLLREQLSYFDDIDYSEKVEYIGKEPKATDIKKYLVKIATSDF